MICHPTTPCDSVDVLQSKAQLESDGYLKINYVLYGNLKNILIPSKQKSTQVDGLWEHTCFEAFVCIQGEKMYYEYNFSPSTQWAEYIFSDYRERLVGLSGDSPCIHTKQSGDTFSLDVLLALPKSFHRKPLQLGLTAVIESIDGSKSYWGLKHPADIPDFHNKNGFILNV